MFILAVVAFVAAFFVPAANAQRGMPCFQFEKAHGVLADKYGEVPVSRGITANGKMIQIYKSEKGTWTALMIDPQSRMACMAGSGTGWEAIEPAKPGKPS